MLHMDVFCSLVLSLQFNGVGGTVSAWEVELKCIVIKPS